MATSNDIRCMLLAAGHGRRLQPLTNSVPKPLLSVLNAPAINYHLRLFRQAGVERFSINTYHLASLLEEKARDLATDSQITFSREDRLLGTGGGIKRMISSAKEDLVIVSNTDAIYNFDIPRLIRDHGRSGLAISLVMIPYTQASPYSRVTITEDLISGFDQKDPASQEGIFTGVHIYSRKALPLMPSRDEFCIVRDYYNPLLQEGHKINALLAKGDWLDTGDPGKYYSSNIAILKNPGNFEVYAEMIDRDYREPSNSVFVHKKAAIGDKCSLSGASMIGKNVKLNECSIGPGTIIGQGCTIGRSTNIKRAILYDGCVIEEGTSVENCIMTPELTLKI